MANDNIDVTGVKKRQFGMDQCADSNRRSLSYAFALHSLLYTISDRDDYVRQAWNIELW